MLDQQTMLLKIFKGNYIYNFFLFPLVAALLLFTSAHKILKSEELFQFQDSALLNILFPAGFSPMNAVLINFIVVLLICFLLLHINAKFSFVKERTFLPVYLYLFIVFALPDLHIIHPQTISAVFIIWAIQRLFSAYDKKNTVPETFDASFMIGLAALFSFNAFIFIILVPVSIFILNGNFTWRSIAVPLTAVILPWIITLSLLFIFSDTDILLKSVKFSFIQKSEILLSNSILQIYFAFLMLLTIIASVFMIGQYGEKSISTRKFFKILFFFFSTSLVILLSPYASTEIMAVMAIPLVFLLTNYLLLMKRRRWAEIFFTALIVISIIVQFFG